jgi:hypothetical protein
MTDFSKQDCVIWPARIDKDGYGVMVIGRKNKRAHRVFYTLFVGPIPDGMCVMHSCDTPACINPEHLSVGTHQENMVDRTKKRRGPIGLRNGNAKLSAEQVLQIRAGTLSRDQALERFGLHKSAFYRVRNGEGYSDVASA